MDTWVETVRREAPRARTVRVAKSTKIAIKGTSLKHAVRAREKTNRLHKASTPDTCDLRKSKFLETNKSEPQEDKLAAQT